MPPLTCAMEIPYLCAVFQGMEKGVSAYHICSNKTEWFKWLTLTIWVGIISDISGVRDSIPIIQIFEWYIYQETFGWAVPLLNWKDILCSGYHQLPPGLPGQYQLLSTPAAWLVPTWRPHPQLRLYHTTLLHPPHPIRVIQIHPHPYWHFQDYYHHIFIAPPP